VSIGRFDVAKPKASAGFAIGARLRRGFGSFVHYKPGEELPDDLATGTVSREDLGKKEPEGA